MRFIVYLNAMQMCIADEQAAGLLLFSSKAYKRSTACCS